MFDFRGCNIGDIKDDVYNFLKEKDLTDHVSAIISSHKDDYVVPDENGQVAVFVQSGSNEGWYVIVSYLTFVEGTSFDELIAIRVQDTLDTAILIQNELIRSVNI